MQVYKSNSRLAKQLQRTSPHPSLSDPTQFFLSGFLVHFRGVVRNRTTSIFFRLLRAASVINAWREKKTVRRKKI